MKKLRVLVVDDSLTIRRRLCEILVADPELEVIGESFLCYGGKSPVRSEWTKGWECFDLVKFTSTTRLEAPQKGRCDRTGKCVVAHNLAN